MAHEADAVRTAHANAPGRHVFGLLLLVLPSRSTVIATFAFTSSLFTGTVATTGSSAGLLLCSVAFTSYRCRLASLAKGCEWVDCTTTTSRRQLLL